ncbi:DNA methyltransferase [Chitinophaga sp. HK235]|uniref:DNA methyltransferase n=1 Tax=Chitinophaga sp. HK235 TaxID=2952571 RepID=UPI001BADC829|nr:DNA methyltransferase [Chitinophaga sp. HK235]
MIQDLKEARSSKTANKIKVSNPKRYSSSEEFETWFPYYAGYSPVFVDDILKSLNHESECILLDPWNGSGTTTHVASRHGIKSIGFDLNPVMVVAAKATHLSSTDYSSLLPLTHDILKKAKSYKSQYKGIEDPLSVWFLPQNAYYIRSIEMAIQRLLVNTSKYAFLKDRGEIDDLSSLAAFFYVALFRTIRKFVASFNTSNPTWIKVPDKSHRLHPAESKIVSEFREQVNNMLTLNKQCENKLFVRPRLGVASSSAIPLESEFVDYIITSPPYCTRIDYAVATLPELTLLGYSTENEFKDIRKSLIGSSTVPKHLPKLESDWGITCNAFLEQVLHHKSKASASYYYKNHMQYFDSIYKSVKEIGRVLKPGGVCSVVVQDSYYKDIHNDLPKVFTEMFLNNQLALIDQVDFVSTRNMDRINPNNKKYRSQKDAVESVLILKKNHHTNGSNTRSDS